MTKEVEFENALDNLITETFTTKKELRDAIKYFTGTDLGELIKHQEQWYD